MGLMRDCSSVVFRMPCLQYQSNKFEPLCTVLIKPHLGADAHMRFINPRGGISNLAISDIIRLG